MRFGLVDNKIRFKRSVSLRIALNAIIVNRVVKERAVLLGFVNINGRKRQLTPYSDTNTCARRYRTAIMRPWVY